LTFKVIFHNFALIFEQKVSLMKKLIIATSMLCLSLLSVVAQAQFYPAQHLPITAANPKPAVKVYFCGGGTEYYSGGACHFYMAGNILGKTDHSDIAGWPTPARMPNYTYDDVQGNYVYYLANLTQFTVTLSGNAAEKLVMACPSGTNPSSANVSGTAVAFSGSGGTYVASGITTLSQLSVLCS
jgi:hypothetical protein